MCMRACPMRAQSILCGGVTEQFVVAGTAQGCLTHYLLPGLEPVNEYRHPGTRETERKVPHIALAL